jgi:hypothetical protein
LLYNRIMNEQSPVGPGRPRQPYCPTCIKEGRPNVPKHKTSKYQYPYCAEHMRLRHRKAQLIAVEELDPVEAERKVYRDEIEAWRQKFLVRDGDASFQENTVIPSLLENADQFLVKENRELKTTISSLQYDLDSIQEEFHELHPNICPPPGERFKTKNAREIEAAVRELHEGIRKDSQT